MVFVLARFLEASMISSRSTILIITVLTAAIFAVDLVMPLGVAVGVMYVLPILIAARVRTRAPLVLILVTLTTVLTLVAWQLSPVEGTRIGAVGNRVVILLVIWALGAFAGRWRRVQREVLSASALLEREMDAPGDGDRNVASVPSGLTESVTHMLRHTTFLESILDSITDGVVVVNQAGEFISFNPAAERILGMGKTPTTPDEWSAAYGLFLPDQKTPMPREKLPLVRAIQGEVVREVEIFVRHAGVPAGIWLSVNAAPLQDRDGTVQGAVAAFRDVTEHKNMIRDIEAARETADAASRAKSVFLANMSHEIRTPLNAVTGLTELVLDSNLSHEQREYLNLVRTSSRTLLSIIEDTLDFSRIESGKILLESSTFDLAELAGNTAKSLAFQADSKGLELVCDIGPDVPRLVIGDAAKLKQVLFNLLGNAIKFTSRGAVSLGIDAVKDKGGPDRIRFSVTDTGIGIPVGKLDVIFDPFEQVDSSIARRFGGSGLGLAISGRLVELMGSRIDVESRLGRGSTFRFDLALQAAPDPAGHESPRKSLQGLRALVVDDHDLSRAAVERILSAWGMDVQGVATTAEAVKRVVQGLEEGVGFSITLVDAPLFERSGCELPKQLKEQHGACGRLLVMLSAGRTPEQIEHCRGMGVEAYLLKPLTASELQEVLLPAGAGETGGRPAAETPRPRHTRRLRILLAEDSPINQRLARDLLERWGHEVTAVTDGRQAVAAADGGNWDLILMDVQMPGMDGLEATRRIRSRLAADAPRVPILAMTAHGGQSHRDECLAAGMDGFLTKPIDLAELFRALERVAGPGGTAPDASQRAESAPAKAESRDGVDWKATLQALGGDRDLLRKIVDAVLEEAPRLVESMDLAVAGGDAPGLRRAAHTLAGTICTFGESRVVSLARSIEDLAAAGKFETAAPLIGDLQREWKSLARNLAVPALATPEIGR